MSVYSGTLTSRSVHPDHPFHSPSRPPPVCLPARFTLSRDHHRHLSFWPLKQSAPNDLRSLLWRPVYNAPLADFAEGSVRTDANESWNEDGQRCESHDYSGIPPPHGEVSRIFRYDLLEILVVALTSSSQTADYLPGRLFLSL